MRRHAAEIHKETVAFPNFRHSNLWSHVLTNFWLTKLWYPPLEALFCPGRNVELAPVQVLVSKLL